MYALVRFELPHEGCKVFEAVVYAGTEEACREALYYQPYGPEYYDIVEIERDEP